MLPVPRCSASCAASHGHGDERQEALAVHRSGAEYGGKYELVDRQQRQGMQQRPREPDGAA
jgi:hypothetical protein